MAQDVDLLEREDTLESEELDGLSGTAKMVVGRRKVLGVIGGGIALAGCSTIPGAPPAPGVPGAPPAPGAPPPTAPVPVPVPPASTGPVPTVLSADAGLHLLRRATFGFGAADVAEMTTLGPAGWLAQQLDPTSIDDSVIEDYLGRYPALGLTAQQIDDLDYDNGGRQHADEDLIQATVARQVFSQRKLFEKVVEFWSNHFSVQAPSDDSYGRKTVEDREVIRAGALGRFADLLLADAKSPAMLRFLNQEQSRADGENVPNENYARELMELHTLGAGSGYTEDDVKELSRLLTGMTRNDTREYVFDENRHDANGPIRIMTFESANADPATAEAEIDRFVDYLAHLPQTAAYLSFKLARHFVSDNPPQSLVDSLAAAFVANDTQIVPWLQALFTSPEFNSSVGQKVRRPVEDIAQTVISLGLTLDGGPENDGRLLGQADYRLHAPFAWPTPDGYPDVAAAWMPSGGLLASWNFHWDTAHNDYDDMLSSADEAIAALIGATPPATAGELVDTVAMGVVFQQLAADHHAAVLEYLGLAAADPVAADGTADLAAAAAATIWNSPYHCQR